MGEFAVLQTEGYHSNYAVAISETSICRIHKKDLDQYLDRYPEIMRRILSDITKRLQLSENKLCKSVLNLLKLELLIFYQKMLKMKKTILM